MASEAELLCQFCGDRVVTKPRFKPSEDYVMEYDLCDECAANHKKNWDFLNSLSQKGEG